jgi:hypothetical protein
VPQDASNGSCTVQHNNNAQVTHLSDEPQRQRTYIATYVKHRAYSTKIPEETAQLKFIAQRPVPSQSLHCLCILIGGYRPGFLLLIQTTFRLGVSQKSKQRSLAISDEAPVASIKSRNRFVACAREADVGVRGSTDMRP